MPESKKATIIADMTPFNRSGPVELEAVLHYGDLDQPNEITVVVHEDSAENLNKLMKADLDVGTVFGANRISGTTEDGVTFEADLEVFSNMQMDAFSGGIQLSYLLGDFTVSNPPCEDCDCKFWVYGVANYKVSIGDQTTEIEFTKDKKTIRQRRANRIEHGQP